MPTTISSISALPIPVADGGTGAGSLTGVLIGNGTSAVTASAVTQYDVLVGDASNAISSISPSTSGYVLTSNGTSSNPTFQAPPAAGLPVVNVTSSSATMTANKIYINNIGGVCTLTLPATAAVGDIFYVIGATASASWKIAQNAGQAIFLSTDATSTGTGGYVESTYFTDAILLICVIANTRFTGVILQGTILVN